MKNWLVLSCAILLEVAGTMSLRAAIDDPWWSLSAVVGYGGAFTILTYLLRRGASIGVLYGVWAAAGVALTAIAASVIFGEPFTFVIALGIAIVIAGVILVETGRTANEAEKQELTS